MMTNDLPRLSIRKNDQVQVIAGREKGKVGKVLNVSTKTGRVTIEKVNMVKRHVRPTQKNPQGGILEKESPLHYSNVLLLCPKCNRGVRHGHKMVERAVKKGSKSAAALAKQVKIRVCKRCGESLDVA
jgi:large subunit ribosomal protein L24